MLIVVFTRIFFSHISVEFMFSKIILDTSLFLKPDAKNKYARMLRGDLNR